MDVRDAEASERGGCPAERQRAKWDQTQGAEKKRKRNKRKENMTNRSETKRKTRGQEWKD